MSTQQNTTSNKNTEPINYPIQLTNGIGRLHLPFYITANDAERIAKMVSSVIIDQEHKDALASRQFPNTPSNIRINPKIKLNKNEIRYAGCTEHGLWYSGEAECPDCFSISLLPWYKRIFS